MKTLYLHIGQEKTGTTSVQQFLSVNRSQLLKEHGILYPFSDGISSSNERHFNHSCFAAAFLPESKRSFVHQSKIACVSDAIENLCKNVELDSKTEKALLSCEHFSSRFGDKEVCQLARSLNQYHVRIICYVRRQDDYQISRFSEALRSGTYHWLDLTKKPADLNRMNYLLNLEPWIKYFGVDAVNLRSFDSQSFKRSGLLVDFLDTIGIRTSDKFIFPEYTNTSVTYEQAVILKELNKFLIRWKDVNDKKSSELFSKSQKMRRDIIDLMSLNNDVIENSELKSCFSLEDRRKYMTHFDNSNRILSELFFHGKSLFSSIEED